VRSCASSSKITAYLTSSQEIERENKYGPTKTTKREIPTRPALLRQSEHQAHYFAKLRM
jgi:hypothetical protein